MDLQKFLNRHGLTDTAIDGPGCLEKLLEQMEEGLAGRGKIPMIPSYLSLDISPIPGARCCVMDAGGTNLRVARGKFSGDGSCVFSDLVKVPMPGTWGTLSADAFYDTLAAMARDTGCPQRIGLCFSYNVALERNLDGILLAWCKEVQVPDAPGKYVGASLLRSLGKDAGAVRVLNDSTAALLGAHGADETITLGLILGTGINICYQEKLENIPKVREKLKKSAMIISTEIGEFDGIPKNAFDRAVIAASDDPALAQAEKQCAGGYLGDLIGLAWKDARKENLVGPEFAGEISLPAVSDYLAGSREIFPEDPAALEIARAMIRRAAKIAAILTAGPVLRSCAPGKCCGIVIEGSQYTKLAGFGPEFLRALEKLLAPRGIGFAVHQVENSCLLGAAMAAFAEPM